MSREHHNTFYDDVGDFHRRFDLAHRGDGGKPRLLEASVMEFRLSFVREELEELEKAVEDGDMVGQADALVDLVYVALGTGHMMRLPLNRIWMEVHRANMEKERAASAEDSKRGSDLDVVKPEGWRPPDVAQALVDTMDECDSAMRPHSRRYQADPSPPPEETNWDARFAGLARHVAAWSKDPSTQVGAVLVGEDPRDVALGYNGFPPGVRDLPERLAHRPTKYLLTQHAERNVLDNAQFETRGATLYVTMAPCASCMKSVASKGVRRVVCPRLPTHAPWGEEMPWVETIARECDVELDVREDLYE